MHEDGLPFNAGVGLRVEPLPPGGGVQYGMGTSIGGLRQQYLNGIEDGVYAYLDQGLLGWELTDLKISLVSYEYDSVSSTPKDYRNLAPLVLFEALKEAGTKLLWPISEFQLTVPLTSMGRAMSDLQRMKAVVDEPVIGADTCQLRGSLPADLCHNYELSVQQYSGGMGHFESKVIRYEEAPQDLYKERPRFKVDPANRGEYLLAKSRVA